MKEVFIITDLKPDILKKDATVLVADEVKKNLKKILRLRTDFFGEIRFYTYDLSVLRYREIWKFVLLLLRGEKRYLSDQKGNQEEINWLLFLTKDLPKLLYEFFVSLCVLVSTKYKVVKISKIIKEKRKKSYHFAIHKIAYLRTHDWFGLSAGGSVSHIYGVAKGFINSGKELFFVSTDNLALIDKLKCPVYVVNPFRRIRNLREIPEMAYNQDLFDESCRIFDREKPELIYQRYSLNNYTGVILSLRYKILLIIEYNGSEVWMARNWGRRLIFEGMAKRIEILNLQVADLIVVVSEVLKEELLERGIEEKKILVNVNGFEPEMYSPEVNEKEIRKRYGFGDKIVVSFIGTFGPWHGAEVLAEVVKPVVQKNWSIRFLFVGDGARMPIVKEIIKRDHVGEFVILAGLVPQEEAPKYLAGCDILVSPHVSNPDGSRFFGSPTKLFEYMGMGKGIVASDLEQIGEVLEHKETAWLVKPRDVQDLVEGILKLAEDEDLRNELGRNAREEALEKYTWDKHVKRTLDEIEEILQNSN
ncbi:D-inositol-3-phosphate glycosyltransferase [subsurface metagenome]